MTISKIGSATTVRGTAQTLTCNVPSGVQSGDILLAWCVKYHSGDYFVTPSGWSVGIASTSYGTVGRVILYYKVAGGSEPASYDFSYTLNYNQSRIIIMTAWRGVDSANPFNVTGSGTTAKVTPSVTTTIDNCMVLSMPASGVYGGYWYAAPAGVTEDASVNSNDSQFTTTQCQAAVGHFEQATAGATGDKTWTYNKVIDSCRNVTLALAPGAASGGGPIINGGLLRGGILMGGKLIGRN